MMKRKLTMLLMACILFTAWTLPANAMEYQFEAPEAGLFGRPTSDETVYVGVEEPFNTDRSKNTALLPESKSLDSTDMGLPDPIYTGFTPAYTAVTKALYDASGCLGTLKIPAIHLHVKVYEGTDSAVLAKGAGHFPETSIWDGNAAFAAHNRGVTNHFGNIHKLSVGDTITYTTKLGVRTYTVYAVKKIPADRVAVLNGSSQHKLTLLTCVRNQPNYRWCVQAKLT